MKGMDKDLTGRLSQQQAKLLLITAYATEGNIVN